MLSLIMAGVSEQLAMPAVLDFRYAQLPRAGGGEAGAAAPPTGVGGRRPAGPGRVRVGDPATSATAIGEG